MKLAIGYKTDCHYGGLSEQKMAKYEQGICVYFL